MYSINFTENNKKICLSLHYNGANSYYFVNGTAIHKFKEKFLKLQQLFYVQKKNSKDSSADNMKKTGLNGCNYDYSAGYDAFEVDDLLNINKYLMKKNNMT